MELKCGVCGNEANIPDDDLSGSGWFPYVFNGDEEVSPVCPAHEVTHDADGTGLLVQSGLGS